MKILKWFKNQIWLPSPGPRMGPGPRMLRTMLWMPRTASKAAPDTSPGPRISSKAAPDTSLGPRTASKAAPDTSPGPRTASKAAPVTSPRPPISSKAARHQPRAPDIIQGCPGHYLWLLVTPASNGHRISSKDCLPGLSCASTLFAATVIAVCIIVTSTSLTFPDVLYIWLLDGYTSGIMSLSCYSLAVI